MKVQQCSYDKIDINPYTDFGDFPRPMTLFTCTPGLKYIERLMQCWAYLELEAL